MGTREQIQALRARVLEAIEANPGVMSKVILKEIGIGDEKINMVRRTLKDLLREEFLETYGKPSHYRYWLAGHRPAVDPRPAIPWVRKTNRKSVNDDPLPVRQIHRPAGTWKFDHFPVNREEAHV